MKDLLVSNPEEGLDVVVRLSLAQYFGDTKDMPCILLGEASMYLLVSRVALFRYWVFD